MLSGLFSAKTVVHLSTAPATASFEHAVAVSTGTPALNKTALIARCVFIMSSLISSVHAQQSLLAGSNPAACTGSAILPVGGCDRSNSGHQNRKVRQAKLADGAAMCAAKI